MDLHIANIWQYVAVGAIALALSLFVLLLYTRRERRRYRAVRAAQELAAWGLQEIPDVLLAYGVGDYSGIAVAVDRLLDAIRDRGMASLIQKLWEKALPHFAADPDWRKKIEAALSAAAPAGTAKTAAQAAAKAAP